MVEHVKQRRRERQRRRPGQAVGLERDRQAQTDEDDADVLDRVIGEQPLQIVFHQRIQHAHHRGQPADGEHDDACPPGGQAEQVEDDADEAVHRHFRHHAAHQRGNVAGRGRMRERQPDMQRHHTRLRAGTDQRQQQRHRGDARGRVHGPHRIEGVIAGRSGQHAEPQQQA